MVLAMAVVGTLLADIHGPPVLAGAAVGAWLSRSLRPPQARLRPGRALQQRGRGLDSGRVQRHLESP
jgi:hypothetical protein